MDQLDYQHKDLAAGRWAKMPFSLQLGNIGSEVSRALKWQAKGKEKLMNSAIDRALELFDLSISATREHGKLRELCRARETFCDFFFNENSFHTNPQTFQAYFDQFVSLSV
ncbi:hypothetical protein IKG48_01805 [Candidatus Saccharibacteria bacterium]|nr:hypothetical protein [Candidatus Saccharibacteria bacterium]